MPDQPPQRIDSFNSSAAFCQAVQDVIQFISDQKDLGNTGLHISEPFKETMDAWKNFGTKGFALNSDFIFQGPERAKIWFVDSSASSCNGESGDLLKKMITAMNLDPGNVLICNCKVRNILEKKIKEFCPAFLVLLGETSVRRFTGNQESIETVQGKFCDCLGTAAMPIYHPQDLLVHPDLKRPVWDSLQRVMEKMGLKK